MIRSRFIRHYKYALIVILVGILICMCKFRVTAQQGTNLPVLPHQDNRTNADAHANTMLNSNTKADANPNATTPTDNITASLHMITDLPDSNINDHMQLSFDHHYINRHDLNGILSIYPLSPELKILPCIYSTAKKYVIGQSAWVGDELLMSGIKGNFIPDSNDDHYTTEDCRLFIWNPGDTDLHQILPYGVSIMIPDHDGTKVAFINRFIDSSPVYDHKTFITIYDLKQKKELITLKFPDTGTMGPESYPVGWSKDDKSIFFIYTLYLEQAQEACPVLYSINMKGSITQLTKTWININQQIKPNLLTNERFDFQNVTLLTGNSSDDLVAPLAVNNAPQLHIGYFDAHHMSKELNLSADQIPMAWKHSEWQHRVNHEYNLTPDGKHVIFQDVNETITSSDGIQLHPLYLWNIENGAIAKFGECQIINGAFGWQHNAMIFLMIGSVGKNPFGIISLHEKTKDEK